MTKQKTLKKSLLSSIVALFVCFAMLLGTTFAWFTDSVTSKSNVIKSGTLEIALEKWDDEQNDWVDASATPIFNYVNWEPGYTEIVNLRVVNLGSLALKWEATITTEKELSKLADAINVYVRSDDQNDTVRDYINGITDRTQFATLANELQFKAFTLRYFIENVSAMTKGTLVPEQESYLGIVLQMDPNAGNEYQGLDLGGMFDLTILATQATYETDGLGNEKYDENANYTDVWTSEADYSWYDPDATLYTLNTAAAVAGLANLVDGNAEALAEVGETNNNAVTFEGKTVKLNNDIDLAGKLFDPIGSYRFDKSFKGTFDGQAHTIKGLSQNTWDLDNGYYYNDCGLGLFAAVEDATIKNLKVDNANLSGESAIVGIVAAVAHNTTFENITVSNSKGADYQYYSGGIVGWASGEQTFINCTVDASTQIAAQWGDFDNSTGGIIGGASGSAEILIKDCTVACVLDVYNDVTSSYQWYAYRRCGMLIGNTGKTETVDGRTVAVAPQLTCENVTVIYDEWADYTYCAFAGTSWPYVRVQAGVSNSAYSNPRYGHPTDANGNEVVDDNHVHNEGEDHQILCVFDQLYGGGQGVYGKATHDGVTVVYNNPSKQNQQ